MYNMTDIKRKKLFVAMPFGERESYFDDRNATKEIKINFDDIWEGILSPAIPEEFFAKRADELQESGIIDQLYIEWLLDADVVLADITFGNPNVYYELGIRQALSKRGTVLVAQIGTALPFDIASQNVLYYDYFNASSLNKFQNNLAERISNAASHEKDSPVHIFLPGLFVKRYKKETHPEEIIEQLNCKILELETKLSNLKKRESVERVLRKLNNSNNPNQLIPIYFAELAQDHSSIEVLEVLAIKLRKIGKIAESMNILKRGNELYPNDFEILRELGFCYRKLGKEHFEEAKKHFKAALKLNDADPELHGMIGGMLKREGKYDDAFEHYHKAYSLVDDDLYSLVNLGAISILLNNRGNSNKYYKIVIELCNDKIEKETVDYWTHLCKGEALVALGIEPLCLQSYNEALILSPPIEDLRSASEQLEIFCEIDFKQTLSKRVLDEVLYPYLK